MQEATSLDASEEIDPEPGVCIKIFLEGPSITWYVDQVLASVCMDLDPSGDDGDDQSNGDHQSESSEIGKWGKRCTASCYI